MRLRHLHLPSLHPHYVPYSLANRVQEHLRRQHLDFKDQQPPQEDPPLEQPPLPTLLSFTPSPIYTLGRRQTSSPTAADLSRLTAPLQISPPRPINSTTTTTTKHAPLLATPKVLPSPRGGLTTYHGPGQVVLWPVLDLRSAHHRQYTVKCYARLLEETTIAVLGAVFGLRPFTTEDPGVWVRSRSRLASSSSSSSVASPSSLSPSSLSPSSLSSSSSSTATTAAAADRDAAAPSPPHHPSEEAGGEMAKIAALGVHLRRHITALGTAVNIAMPGPGVADERVNPWARFVACGLEGKGVTSVAGEVGEAAMDGMLGGRGQGQGRRPVGDGRTEVVASAWADVLASKVGLEAVEAVDGEEAVRLVEGLVGEGDDGELGEERAYVEWMREVVRGTR